MSQPRDYTRNYNFNDFQTTNPSDPLPASQVDNEFNDVKLTLDDLNANIALIQRDDGKLANASVHKEALSQDALALVTAGNLTPRGDWAATTVYAAADIVNFNDATYLATVAHTAVSAFATDLASGNWILIANAAIAGTASAVDKFEGDGSQTAFTLTYSYTGNTDVQVYVNGALRNPGDDYSISTNTLTFVTAPSVPAVAGNENVIVWGTSVVVEAAKSAAQAASSNASGFATTAQDWAEKTSGPVTGTSYSSKYWATSTPVTNVGNNINDVTTVAGQISPTNNIATVVSRDADIGTVAARDANIGVVAARDADIGTVAARDANIGVVAARDADIGTVASRDADIGTVASRDADIGTVASRDADIGTLALIGGDITSVAAKASLITSDFVSDLNQVAVSDVVADINLLATSDIVSDINLLATSDIVSDLNQLATSDIITDINLLADSDVITDLNLLGTSDFVSDLNSLADRSTDIGLLADIEDGTVATNAIQTVAANISGITSFAEIYRSGATDPTTNLDEGDLFYNTTSDTLKVYNGSAWEAGVTAGSDLLPLAGGQLTGNLTFSGTETVDGRDVSVDGTKLDGIEELADVTDTTNVTAAGAAMLTGATFSGAVAVDNQLDIEEVHEKVTVITSTTGTLTFDTAAGGVVLGTADQTANRTINFTNVNSTLAIGQSVTCAVLLTQGSSAYYLNAYQVDASSVTPKWQGGTAPTAGNVSGIDAYSFTIIKTADATFTVLASQTAFA